MTPNAQATIEKNDTLNIKIDNFYASKDIIKKVKGQATNVREFLIFFIW